MGIRRHETLGLRALIVVALGASGLAWASAPAANPVGPDAAVPAPFESPLRLALDTSAMDPDAVLGTGDPSEPARIVVALPPAAPLPFGDEPVVTGSLAEPRLPELPPAAVTVRTDEAVAGAIQLRLGRYDAAMPVPRLPRREREAVAAFYADRAGAPLWVGRDGWNPRGAAVVALLARADEDGLDPAQYPAPAVPVPGRPDLPAELADAELRLSALAVLYARDLRGGRLDPSRISALITPKLDLPGADAILPALAAAPEPSAALASHAPSHPGYVALRRKLAEIRAARPAGVPSARGPDRRDLVTHSIAALDDVPAMRPALLSNPRLEADLVANMERWRWLPADLGPRHVAVNIPEYRLRLMEDGRVAHETRVITGKPESPTPVFSGLMEYAVVNPSWFIPPSILKNEILPGLAADPSYAERRGYEVIRRGGQISVRQPPGERNALGFIKFMFPNGHSVYLHDTPNRSLFASARRAFSHGCVRVENPFRLADFVLGREWTEARLKRLIGRGERTIFLPAKLPVHLTYFTLDTDETGELRAYDDVYGINRRVRSALGFGA